MSESILGHARRVRSSPPVAFLESAFAPTWRRDVLAVLVIVSLFVPTFLEARLNPGGTDDCAYFEYAAGMNAGAPHHQQRFALLGTVLLAQMVFGYTSWAYYAVPFVYSLGLVLASYFAARSLMGVALSSLAALMVLALPVVLQQGTWLLPDIPSVFWIVIGVGIFMRALRSEAPQLPIKRAIGSGICLFLAVSTKESTAPLLLGIGVFPLVLASKRAFKILLLTGATTLTLALIEMSVMWAVFDDALYRLHAVSEGHLPQMEKFARTQADLPEHVTWGYLATRFLESMANHRYINGWPFLGLGYWDWFAVSLPFAVAAAVLGKNRLLLGLFGFVLWSYLSLTFAPSSFDPLIPIVRTKDRYFLVVLVWLPIAILAAWSYVWTWPFERPPPSQWPRLRALSIVGASALYAVVAFGTARHYLGRAPSIRNGHSPITEFYQKVTALTKAGARVKRVVGPRPLRAAGFMWPQTGLEIAWRSNDLESRKKPKARDLLITSAPPALQVPTGLIWQLVDQSKAYDYYHLDDWRGSRSAGSYGLLGGGRVALRKHPTVELGVRLRLKGDRVKPTPLRVLLYRKEKPEGLETLDWKVEGDLYTLQTTSRPFQTKGVQAVSLEFDVEGPGRFTLKRPQVRVVAVRKQ